MEKYPKVSIVIPVYNGSKYMKEAIDSALGQTYKNIEIIVVNDGSNDKGKTNDIAISYGNKIHYYVKENGGVSSALNMAISKMSGEYFSWLSHDDVYYPDKIEKQINYLLSNGYDDQNIILYSDYDLIDSKSRLINVCTKDHKMLLEKPEYALLRGSINGITLLIPSKAFDDFGLFDEELRCVQDYEMWQRMSKKYSFEHMIGIVAKSRQHSEQVTIKNIKVITEGNKLWIDMIEALSIKEMEKLEGSQYNYYKEMAKFLSDSPYEETKRFCEDKYNKINQDIKKDIDNIKVSVIIPFFNRENLVINSINSVIKQTHKNIEIIVINDGSTENINKVKQLVKSDDRIKFINIKTNEGVSKARNIGIDESTGDYVAFLDSDDLFKKNKIRRQLTEMLLNNSVISHTSYLRKGFNEEVVFHSGELTGSVIPKIIYSCIIATPTVMIKRKLLSSKKARFNENLTIGEDTCFWLELLRKNNILGIDDDLTIVNVLESSSAYNIEKQITGFKTILGFVLNDEEFSKYSYEIALLCNSYIRTVNEFQKQTIENVDNLCPNCLKMINSRSWKITKPFRMFMMVTKSIKQNGIITTSKKVLRKLLKRNKK